MPKSISAAANLSILLFLGKKMDTGKYIELAWRSKDLLEDQGKALLISFSAILEGWIRNGSLNQCSEVTVRGLPLEFRRALLDEIISRGKIREELNDAHKILDLSP